MFDLIIRGALVVDPLNKINAIKDVAVAKAKSSQLKTKSHSSCKETHRGFRKSLDSRHH